LKEKLVKRKSEFSSYLETLRAFLSQHVFFFLAQILRDSNIKDCRLPDMRVKRVSLCAVLGLMLEQLLDLVEQCRKKKDEEQVVKAKQLVGLLLAYLQPPSILSSVPNSPVNQRFGTDASWAGFYFHDSFWYELYKESVKEIPPHLLFIADQSTPENPEQDVLCNVAPPATYHAPFCPDPAPIKPRRSIKQKSGHQYAKKVADLTNGFLVMSFAWS
jgi:hypothetical protein